MTKRVTNEVVSRAFLRLAFLLCCIHLGACSAEAPAEPAHRTGGAEQVITVETLVAGQAASGGEIFASGTLEALNQTQIGAKEGGIVKEILVEVGSRVKKGQVLVAFEQKDLSLGADLAEAVFHNAQVTAETAEKDYNRYKRLHEEGSVTTADYDKAVLNYKTAGYGLKQAEAQFKLAQNRVSDALVRAPYDGQIIQRLVSLGSYVDAGSHPTLFVMVDPSRLKVNLYLPEARAALVSPGDEVRIALPSHDRTFTLPIAVIADAVDPSTHTRLAVAWIDNSGTAPLPSGIFFDARIKPKKMLGKIMIPTTAVRTEPGPRHSAYVVQGGKATLRRIEGAFLPDHSDFIVARGLTAGESVIVEASAVRDGQPVAVSGFSTSPEARQGFAPANTPREKRK